MTTFRVPGSLWFWGLVCAALAARSGLLGGVAFASSGADVFEQTETYTVENPSDRPATVTISVRDTPPGLAIVPDSPILTIPPNGTASFSARITIDDRVLPSGTEHRAFIEVDGPDGGGFTLPVLVEVPHRVALSPFELEFVPPPGGTGQARPPGPWSATRVLEIRNTRARDETFELRADCCRDARGGPAIAGVQVTVTPRVTVGPRGTLPIDVTVVVDDRSLPPDGAAGEIWVSSPLQIAIPVLLTLRGAPPASVAVPASAGPRRFIVSLAAERPATRYHRVHRDQSLSDTERRVQIEALKLEILREQEAVLQVIESALGVRFVTSPSGVGERRLFRGPEATATFFVLEMKPDEAASVKRVPGIRDVQEDEELPWRHVAPSLVR